jgi:hypothetical protein
MIPYDVFRSPLTSRSLLYGYNQGVFGGVLVMNAFGKHMGDYTENSSKMGWLVSILELGAWLGTLYSGFLAEIFSRKYAILVNTAIFILGVVIQSTAVTGAGHNSILAGRFITGELSCLLPIDGKKLTRRRYGCWFAVHDRTDVQCRVCAAGNSRRHGYVQVLHVPMHPRPPY